MKKIFSKIPTQTKLFWILKITACILCVGIIISAVTGIITTIASFDFQYFILSLYLVGFAVKIILCEIHFKYALLYFPYMKSYIGKGIFFIFVGIVMISFGFFKYLVTSIMGIVMVLCGIGFIILRFIPATRRQLVKKEIAEAEALEKSKKELEEKSNIENSKGSEDKLQLI